MTIRYSHATVRCVTSRPRPPSTAISSASRSPAGGLRLRDPRGQYRRTYVLHLVQVGPGLDELLGRCGGHAEGRAALTSNLEHLGLNSDDAAEADPLRARL